MSVVHCVYCGAPGERLGPVHYCQNCFRVFDLPLPKSEVDPRPRALARTVSFTPENLTMARIPSSQPAGDPYRNVAMARDDLEIAWAWSAGRHRGLAFFAVVWNLFMIPFYGAALGGAFGGGVWLFLLPFAGVGGAFTYFALAQRLNVTTIRIQGDNLTAKQFPFPTRRKREVNADAIKQLWVERSVPYEENDVPVVCFSVMLETEGGDKLNLVPNMDTPEQALWVEQQLEDCLGIIDVAMPGEIEAPDKDFEAPTGF